VNPGGCWPQACLSDWAGYELDIWAATFGVGFVAIVLSAAPWVLIAAAWSWWRSRRRARAT
jgi:hypothetical protein